MTKVTRWQNCLCLQFAPDFSIFRDLSHRVRSANWAECISSNLPGLRGQLISLSAGACVPEHKVQGAITVRPVLGRVQMTAFGSDSADAETNRAQSNISSESAACFR